ncbi:MAG: four helix bundle protein [bacterium]
MDKAKVFEDLVVWQKAHQLVLNVYQYTKAFPNWELFGLSAQLRRAAVSIPANLAEGFKKRGRLDKARFLNIAQGSLEECRYYLRLAQDLGYGNSSDLNCGLEETSRLLNAYYRAIIANK